MKILIQDNAGNFVWKDAEYKNKSFFIKGSNNSKCISDIYAVQDDDRHKIVTCSACGKEVPNTKAAMKAHQEMIDKAEKCFECRYLKAKNANVLSHKYTLNEDGTYNESSKRCVSLVCHKTWDDWDINSQEARQRCIYAACEHATFNQIEDFWTRYPGAFDDMITVDKIIDFGYKSMHKYGDNIEFTIRCRSTLYVCVNPQGICSSIKLVANRHTYYIRYSKKYDKVWYESHGTLSELSNLGLAESTVKSVTDKLRALYA